MTIDLPDGILRGTDFVASPNYDERPAGLLIDMIVVHGISLPPGEFGGPWIDALFCNELPADVHPYFAEVCDFRVSAHVCIRRDGHLVQYVPFARRAWHAGQSEFDGRSACNDFSIGIELEGTDDVPYDDRQYSALAALCRQLLDAYPAIRRERIVGHCHIAPGRKTDPGESFQWNRFLSELQP